MPFSRIAKKKIEDTERKLRTVEARSTLREAVKTLAPTIEERHKDGIPLDHLFQTVARSLDASPDAVGKWYRHLKSEQADEPRRRGAKAS
jgi:hypothetical protein